MAVHAPHQPVILAAGRVPRSRTEEYMRETNSHAMRIMGEHWAHPVPPGLAYVAGWASAYALQGQKYEGQLEVMLHSQGIFTPVHVAFVARTNDDVLAQQDSLIQRIEDERHACEAEYASMLTPRTQPARQQKTSWIGRIPGMNKLRKKEAKISTSEQGQHLVRKPQSQTYLAAKNGDIQTRIFPYAQDLVALQDRLFVLEQHVLIAEHTHHILGQAPTPHMLLQQGAPSQVAAYHVSYAHQQGVLVGVYVAIAAHYPLLLRTPTAAFQIDGKTCVPHPPD